MSSHPCFGQSPPLLSPSLHTLINTHSLTESALETEHQVRWALNECLLVFVVIRNTTVTRQPWHLFDFYLLIPKLVHCAFWNLRSAIRKISHIFECLNEHSLLLIPSFSRKTRLPLQLSQSAAVCSSTSRVLLGLEFVKMSLIHMVSSNLIYPPLKKLQVWSSSLCVIPPSLASSCSHL